MQRSHINTVPIMWPLQIGCTFESVTAPVIEVSAYTHKTLKRLVTSTCCQQCQVICEIRDLARILKLPVCLNSIVPVQNCLKWIKMVQNGHFSDHLK